MGESVAAWLMSSSSDRRALDVVDGTGPHAGAGPHYSRRTPGSRTFTGVGREVVLVTSCGRAVWACVYQRTPAVRGSGGSRGRLGETDVKPRFLWRNMMFRNLGAGLSSILIREATEATYSYWITRYGALPLERLRTEIGVEQVRSRNPGYCYECAGWERGETRNGKLFLWAPPPIGWRAIGVQPGQTQGHRQRVDQVPHAARDVAEDVEVHEGQVPLETVVEFQPRSLDGGIHG